MSEQTLIDAVKNGQYVEVERLISSGSDINQEDEHEWTPLDYAAGNGDLRMVKLLVERGADIFKTGLDQRTPYMIALAAGRVSVVKYLREVEDNYQGDKPARPVRKYCKAYYLGDLRSYPAWSESRINWKNANGGEAEEGFGDDKIVYIHNDFTVTESVFHNENVIFNQVDSSWIEFCESALQFKAPDDIDLIIPNEAAAAQAEA